MNRRMFAALFGGAVAAPAVAKAAARAEMVAGRVPLPGALGGNEFGQTVVGQPISCDPPNGLTERAYHLLQRERYVANERRCARKQAWGMVLDPDLAAMPSCSETYLRHLQEQRILAERAAEDEMNWRVWGLPDWMQE